MAREPGKYMLELNDAQLDTVRQALQDYAAQTPWPSERRRAERLLEGKIATLNTHQWIDQQPR